MVTSPAALGRLCVETLGHFIPYLTDMPAAFGRLCVETLQFEPESETKTQPPSGGCVLKLLCVVLRVEI